MLNALWLEWSAIAGNAWFAFAVGVICTIIIILRGYHNAFDASRSKKEQGLWLLAVLILPACFMCVSTFGYVVRQVQSEQSEWVDDYQWRSLACRNGQKLYWLSKGEADFGILYCLEGHRSIPTTLSRYDRDRKTGDITKTIVLTAAHSNAPD